jgi:hypothetical protein
MSIAEALSEITTPVKSANRWGRSKFRRKSRANPHKKTSPQYEKKSRKMILNHFEHDNWRPCPSGYPRGECWNMLFKAWIGYKRANNPKNGEGFFDRLHWAQIIQNVQTDLGLQRSSFPQLGLLGDVVFLYDKVKEWEIQDLDNELSIEEYKKQKRAHIKEIVHSSLLSEQGKEWMKEYASQSRTDTTYDNENKHVERIIMPNFFDVPKNHHG